MRALPLPSLLLAVALKTVLPCDAALVFTVAGEIHEVDDQLAQWFSPNETFEYEVRLTDLDITSLNSLQESTYSLGDAQISFLGGTAGIIEDSRLHVVRSLDSGAILSLTFDAEDEFSNLVSPVNGVGSISDLDIRVYPTGSAVGSIDWTWNGTGSGQPGIYGIVTEFYVVPEPLPVATLSLSLFYAVLLRRRANKPLRRTDK